ncbi:hypothetical protein tinsulaeT_29760 [Thalassotalea insulae]|uniref:BACON domain-containing protein n=1 Tax=Thalassotalea insulae TaxID=2056778 RepID=A0ABQ6GYE2_9GAMM|nr:hypothetical protein [Thalassotalea insulae]GLX79636.1 hypothetical protein tinsulaeT_29760 [Thalassotalea insulae]
MKEYLNQFCRMMLMLTLAAILQACGGSSDKSAKYTISANTSTITFSNEFLQISDDSYQVDVTFDGNGLLVGFAPDSEPVGWLNFHTENVTTNSATLIVNVVNAENIIANNYHSKLRLSTGDVDKVNLVHHDIDVSLLIWQLLTDKERLSYHATFGEASVASQTLTISSEENQWKAQTDSEWLALDISEGTGNGVLTVTPNLSAFNAAGLYQANITLTEVTTGDSKVIPVELGLDRHYLYSNHSSISLSQLSDINATTATVTINSNSPTPLKWQASSNVDWLSLTPNAESNELTVSVDKGHSFVQALNQAKITVNAIDNENHVIETVEPELINVAFYHVSELSENHTIEDITINNQALIASPALPYVYLGEANQLKVFHQYTGELLSILEVAPENSLLESFIIHPDGELLIAKADETIVNEDETESTVTHRYQINLTDLTVNELSETTIEYEPLRYISLGGRHFIITQALEIADDNLQRQYWDQANAFFTNNIDQASQSEAIYALDLSDSSFKRLTALVNDFTTEPVVLSQTHHYRPERLAEDQIIRDFIVNDNDSGIYAISPTSEWISFDGENFSDQGLLAQDENSTTLLLTKSNNSRAHYLRFEPTQGFIVDIYNETLQRVNSINTQGQQPTDVALAHDGKRIAINAGNAKQLELINIEQIAVSNQALAFNTTFGNASIVAQEFIINGVSDQWQISSDSEWLKVITTDSEDGIKVTATIDSSSIAGWGLFTGHITVFDPASNSSSIVTVTLAVDEIRLYGHTPSLAFNQQFDKSYLTQTINILTNSENAIAWQASTEANWLTLSSDTVNNTLTVTADPSKLTSDGQFNAEITLSPQTAGASVDGVINVSLTKGNFDTSDFSELVIDAVTPNSSGVVLDPIRPYLYVAQSDAIDVYNIIDGTMVTRMVSPVAETDLTNLVIHPDGSVLLTSNVETYLDENEQQQTRTNYYRVDLSTRTFEQLASDGIDIEYAPAKIIIISGKAVVVTEALELADLNLHRQYWDSENAYLSSILTGVTGSNTLIALDAANANLRHHTMIYNAFADSKVEISATQDYINNAYSNGVLALATSKDGQDIYTANTASEWSSFDSENFNDQGLLDGNPFTSPVSVSTDNMDNSYFYRFDLTIGYFTLSKYDENQVNLWASAYSAGSTDIYISAEYQRLIHYNSDEQKLVIDYIAD